MASRGNEHRGVNYFITAATLVIILWGIHEFRSVIVPFLISVLLAVIGTSPLVWLERKRVPSVIAVLLVVGGMVCVLLVIGVLVGTSVNRFSNDLPAYEARIHERIYHLNELLMSKDMESADKIVLKYVNPAEIMKLAASLFSGLGSVLSNIVLILLTVMFILLEASSFPIKLRDVLGLPQATFDQLSRFIDSLKRYMVIQTVISLTAGIFCGIWLAVLGLDFSVLLALLAFLFNYVPNLGSIIAAIPAVLLAFIQFGIGRAALTAAGYIVIFFTLGNIVQPRLLGRGLGLSTLVVFLSLIFWGSLLGVVGMVLSVPITMAFKIAFESHESTRWIALLLGPESPPEGFPSARKDQDAK